MEKIADYQGNLIHKPEKEITPREGGSQRGKRWGKKDRAVYLMGGLFSQR